MPTANLFQVTHTLQRLLELNVEALLKRYHHSAAPVPAVHVTTMPPERVKNEEHTLNIYLYHTVEDPHYRNLPPAGVGQPPVAQESLGLLLYYILTAHHEKNEKFDSEVQQRLFGLAMKTLHDFPTIDDNVTVPSGAGPPEFVMPDHFRGRNNRLDIALRPLTPEESLSFWHADDSVTTRLSAYYEVRTIFLDAEPPTGADGITLDVGLFVSPGQAPKLDRAHGLMAFTPPDATGLPAQARDVSPPRATLAPGLPAGPVNRILLEGSDLGGDGTPGSARILLRSGPWSQLVPPVRQAPIDPGLNPSWAPLILGTEARFDMQKDLTVAVEGGGTRTIETTPGIYSASIEVTRKRKTATGGTRSTVQESNRIAFSLGARIDHADPLNAKGRFHVAVVNLFDMMAADLDVQLAVDGEVYREVTTFAGTAADEGAFQRQAGGVEFHPTFDPTVSGAYPVRLTINGAESQPFWIIVP